MTDEKKIWVGRDGQRFGPYDEATLRAWIAEGKVSASSLGWYDGMTDWRPLHEILGMAVPPPMAGGMPPLHSELPAPPDLHWGLLFVIDLFVGGLLSLVWQFVQSTWIKKIDPSSKATIWLIVSLCTVPISWFGMFSTMFGQPGWGQPGYPPAFSPMIGGFTLLGLAGLVFRYIGIFSMARSMRENLPRYGLVPEIGGVTLFFFTHYYLQGQMSWVARWRRTGQVEPPAPKGAFWIVMLACLGFMVLMMVLIGAALFAQYQH